jgi:transcription elongation factor
MKGSKAILKTRKVMILKVKSSVEVRIEVKTSRFRNEFPRENMLDGVGLLKNLNEIRRGLIF